TTADIRVIPDLFQFQLFSNRPVQSLGIPMIELSGTDIAGPEKVIKSLLDVTSAALLLVLVSPFYLIIGLAIKLDSKGPIHFRQKRLGFSGEDMTILKFRTMLHSNDELSSQQATVNDPRITRIGKVLRRTSLDELPQLINVLLGEMSLVGPRPHAQMQNDEFRDLIPKYMLRHKVKPGITGWAQINGYRGETDTLEKMDKRIEYDLWYIRNWSLWLDITILLRTPMAVIKGRNAY
ncbi:MAG: exopolysaccharide biosynthesis polyprenyl glycosylphosphotransferase, partial [Proteobacteria bacterium]|nr:exopolysaccharide biosynthesis polyprenyl glycosylphosphotransferase [Pseudomonadota bacterium]